jgi:hypothetical protein
MHFETLWRRLRLLASASATRLVSMGLYPILRFKDHPHVHTASTSRGHFTSKNRRHRSQRNSE